MWVLSLRAAPTSAYVHVPFCRRRCHYCDFAIVPVGYSSRVVSGRTAKGVQPPPTPSTTLDTLYVDAVLQEIAHDRRRLEEAGVGFPALQTLYIGGGTPSLLALSELGRLLEALPLALDAEVTLEMDPGTFDVGRARAYRSLGVNRASVGAQSFDDEVLRRCGRTHNSHDIALAVEALHRAGFGDRFSLDVISGLPGVDAARWHRTLEQLMRYRPPHVSIYDLSIEPGTLFARWQRDRTLAFPAEEQAAEMYRRAVHVVAQQHGYDHYEVSNYARESRHRCRHNAVYWRGEAYWGWGLSASSFVDGMRVERPRSLADYLEWVRDGCVPSEVVPGGDLDEWLMLRLRTKEGVGIGEVRERFGMPMGDAVAWAAQRLVSGGLLQRYAQGGDVILRATDPDGFLLLSYVLVELLVDVEKSISIGMSSAR